MVVDSITSSSHEIYGGEGGGAGGYRTFDGVLPYPRD